MPSDPELTLLSSSPISSRNELVIRGINLYYGSIRRWYCLETKELSLRITLYYLYCLYQSNLYLTDIRSAGSIWMVCSWYHKQARAALTNNTFISGRQQTFEELQIQTQSDFSGDQRSLLLISSFFLITILLLVFHILSLVSYMLSSSTVVLCISVVIESYKR